MLMPEFIERYRHRLATPSERYIAIYELSMHGLLTASILLAIAASLLVYFTLLVEEDPFAPNQPAIGGFSILIILGLVAVFTVLFNVLFHGIYSKWIFPVLHKKYPRWPDMP